MPKDSDRNINIISTNQSGGFTGILVQGNVHRTLDDNLKAQLLAKLPKGNAGVMALMGVPDGEPLANQIATFLQANGYTISEFSTGMVAGGMPRGISINKFEDTPTVFINHA